MILLLCGCVIVRVHFYYVFFCFQSGEGGVKVREKRMGGSSGSGGAMWQGNPLAMEDGDSE